MSCQTIIGHLESVTRERLRRAADPSLSHRARAVREYQAARFRQTYADLLAAYETRAAANFFLNELYGVQDFFDRDAQFQRVVPGLVRLFSAEVVTTVEQVAELHALSERLDTRMAQELSATEALDNLTYGQAWRRLGEPHLRERQVVLVGQVGQSLLRYTRHPALGRALRLMRLPARAAGLDALQSFLERGFATFGNLAEPQQFLSTIQSREREYARRLFAADAA